MKSQIERLNGLLGEGRSRKSGRDKGDARLVASALTDLGYKVSDMGDEVSFRVLDANGTRQEVYFSPEYNGGSVSASIKTKGDVPAEQAAQIHKQLKKLGCKPQ